MNISCDCGQFVAELVAFPKNTPGRLVCYCGDCQQFAEKLDRNDVLDDFGGTEVIPAYPKEITISSGSDLLACYQLSDKGLNRWATTCCNSPILNTRPNFPWAGIFHTAYKSKDPNALDELGDIRGRIYGRDAAPGAPFKISKTVAFKDFLTIMPFIIKGKFKKMHENSPFYESDNVTPVSKPTIL